MNMTNELIESANQDLSDKPYTLRKVKAIPVQTWTGPEGSRKFRLQDFKTIGTRR